MTSNIQKVILICDNAEKNRQEVLAMTNIIQDVIEKNNVIFAEKWEVTHDHIDHCLEDILLLKNQVVVPPSTLSLRLLPPITLDVGWLEHSCLPSSSNHLFIPHNNSSKFLLFSLLSVNLTKGTGADIVDPPRLRPHLPWVQLVQDRGSIGGGGRILPQECRVPVHTPRQEDDALARTAP